MRASIIIVSYNNFATTTGPCLASLLADPLNSDHEIIVVDNASNDETKERLAELEKKHPQLRLVLNKNNRGFAGGNNDGAAIARGEILILLNSDTQTPVGSMNGLIHLLAAHPDWDMLGPVTNAAGNEQKIHTSGTTVEEILAQGRQWCTHSHDCHFPSDRIDFFCVAIRKDVYRRLGGLDEEFGLGYYEDTAFSAKAKQAGHRMMVTDDIFVYHHGGRSFSGLEQRRRRSIMRDNREKLWKNYGRDIPLHHLRDCNLSVLAEYLHRKETATTKEAVDLDFKFTNRLTLSRQLYPRNPLKKLRYHFVLRRLCRMYYGIG